jgi:hypothetical protein
MSFSITCPSAASNR